MGLGALLSDLLFSSAEEYRHLRFYNGGLSSSSRVTKSQLYPKLSGLLQAQERCSGSSLQLGSVPDELIKALRNHVSDNMPLRLILLEHDKGVLNMRLVGRNEIIDHIASKMTFIDEGLIEKMKNEIDRLGEEQHLEDLYSREEDVRENPGKAILQFLFQEFARYAILSHTWLGTGEIVYQDTFQKEWLSRTGPGMDKLKGFCEAVHRDHESSAELDESIQSMYRWYQNSSICITYLRDTASLEDMDSDTWFRRGWTLQELIAPAKMQFYNHDWIRLTSDRGGNDKVEPDIQQIISRATGIGAKELVSFDPLTGSDVQTRMRWAASRATTRGEDRAYSLMGIFGVNFSISYGEGTEHAFFRLIEAIISRRHTSHVIQVLHWAGRAIPERIHTSRLIPSGPECYLQTNSLKHATVSQSSRQIVPTIPKFSSQQLLYNGFEKKVADKVNSTMTKSASYPTLAEPMTLTHLGLRVRLLITGIPENQVRIGDPTTHGRGPHYGPFNIMLRFPASNLLESSHFYLEKRFSEMPKSAANLLGVYQPQTDYEFIFGIYTFEEDDQEDCVYFPHHPCAFLLIIPIPRKGFAIQNVSSKQLEPTSKIDTRDVIKLTYRVTHQDDQGSEESKSYIIKRAWLRRLGLKVVNAYL